MKVWDYNLAEDWKPRNKRQWIWYLTRKINYGDWKGLEKSTIKKYFSDLKEKLDPGKRKMLEYYFQREADKNNNA